MLSRISGPHWGLWPLKLSETDKCNIPTHHLILIPWRKFSISTVWLAESKEAISKCLSSRPCSPLPKTASVACVFWDFFSSNLLQYFSTHTLIVCIKIYVAKHPGLWMPEMPFVFLQSAETAGNFCKTKRLNLPQNHGFPKLWSLVMWAQQEWTKIYVDFEVSSMHLTKGKLSALQCCPESAVGEKKQVSQNHCSFPKKIAEAVLWVAPCLLPVLLLDS